MFGWLRLALGRSEARSAPFTDCITRAYVEAALGSAAAPSLLAVSALETAAGLWARGFAAAEVEGDRGALTPPVMASVAHELCRSGNSLWLIQVRCGRTRLLSVGDWDPHGPADPQPRDLPALALRCERQRGGVDADRRVPTREERLRPESAVVRGLSDGLSHSSGALAAWLEQRFGEKASAGTNPSLPCDSEPPASMPDPKPRRSGRVLRRQVPGR